MARRPLQLVPYMSWGAQCVRWDKIRMGILHLEEEKGYGTRYKTRAVGIGFTVTNVAVAPARKFVLTGVRYIALIGCRKG